MATQKDAPPRLPGMNENMTVLEELGLRLPLSFPDLLLRKRDGDDGDGTDSEAPTDAG